ncbi:MAG: rhodanese-like domain-containing protein [Phycisphaerales bacterium]
MQISVEDVKRKLDAGESFILLDCREPNERAHCKIEPSMHIPMKRTADQLDQLPKDKPIIVYCHHGMRSLQVAGLLLRNGCQAQSMSGGIDAWAVKIDKSVPRY